MKKFTKIVLIAIGIISFLLAVIFFLTKDIVKTADNFFIAVKQGEMNQAYDFMSHDFKKATSKAELTHYLKDNAFDSLKKTSWHSREWTNQWGKVEGQVVLKDNKTIPITIDLIDEDGSWKIYAIKKPAPKRAGLQNFSNIFLPTEREVIKLVTDTNTVFIQSVTEKNFQPFYQHISYLWQKQASAKKLKQSFNSFLEANLNFQALTPLAPIFTKQPSLKKKILIVSGRYPTKPLKVEFTHKYIYEGLGWKLIGFKFNAK